MIGMPHLTDDLSGGVSPEILAQLGWRTVWLHGLLTGSVADAAGGELLLAPRDRELLTLVATSVLGVDGRQARRQLRRFGSTPRSAQVAIDRLVELGVLSQHGPRLDLPAQDLAWIAARTEERP